jgi:hypothetical protein
MSNSGKKRRCHALGVAFGNGIVEVYAVNHLNAVVLHGWFGKDAGLAIVRERPPCMIAVEAGTLSKGFIEELEARGHKVVLMPLLAQATHRRQAKTCCEAALNCLRWANDYGYPAEAITGYQFA